MIAELIKNKDNYFILLEDEKKIIQNFDSKYIEFCEQGLRGYYFNKALIIYGDFSKFIHIDIVYINYLLSSNYKDLFENMYAFAADIFGNQYVFRDKLIYLFDIESADLTKIANSFEEWVKLIITDIDYYTGRDILIAWETARYNLKIGQRLTPKKPFIIGGEYNVINLYEIGIEQIIPFNANIARQIKNLPDGTKIRINL